MRSVSDTTNFGLKESVTTVVDDLLDHQPIASAFGSVKETGNAFDAELLLLSSDLAVFLVLEKAGSTAYSGREEQGEMRARVVPRHALVEIEVIVPPKRVPDRSQEDFDGLEGQDVLRLTYLGIKDPVEVRAGTAGKIKALYQSLLADLA